MDGCVRYVLRVARVDSGCTVFSFSKIKPKFTYCCLRTCSIVPSASSLSAFLLLLLLLLLLLVVLLPSVRIQNFLFHFPFYEIYRRLLFFTLGRSVSAWIDYSTTIWNRQTRQHQGRRPTSSPVYVHSLVLRSPSTKRHVMLNLTSTWVCNTNFETRMRGWGAVSSGIVFTDAAVVSGVVLRRPTKEYTHPYSMMHRRSAYCRYWGLASLSPITSTWDCPSQRRDIWWPLRYHAVHHTTTLDGNIETIV